MDINFENLSELKQNYTDEWAAKVFRDGSLKEWAEELYYEKLSVKLDEIPSQIKTNELTLALRKIFGFEVQEEKSEKAIKLAKFTQDEELLKNAEQTAFSQKELGALLKSGTKEIQLCGDEFTIPSSVENIRYTLIGEIKLNIPDNKTALAKKHITIRKAGEEIKASPLEQVISEFSVSEFTEFVYLEKQMRSKTGYDSRYECEQAFNDHLDSLYNEASGWLESSGSRSIVRKMSDYYSEKMNEVLKKNEVMLIDTLTNDDFETLSKLCGCSKPIKEAMQEEMRGDYYTLPEKRFYSPDIEEYVKSIRSGKILKGVMFDVKGWYYTNGYEVKEDITKEVQGYVNELCRFAYQFFSKNILDPIINILEKYNESNEEKLAS